MADREDDRPSPLPRLLIVVLLLAGWAALLSLPVLQPPDLGVASVWRLGSLEEVRSTFGRLSLFMGMAAGRFVPMGLLAVYAFPDRSIGLLRALLVALPACAVGLATAVLGLWLPRRDQPPGPSELLLPALGVLLGVLVGLALRRGLTALVMLPAKLAAGLVLAAILVTALGLSSIEAEPVLPVPRPVSTEDKRQLVRLFGGKDLRRLEAGETRTVHLRDADLERLIAWGLPLLHEPDRVRAELRTRAGGRLRLRISARLPATRRWLNVEASAATGVAAGRLWLRSPRLAVGPHRAPDALLDALAPVAAASLRSERRLQPVLAAVREAQVADGGVRLTLGRLQGPRGLLARLVWGESNGAALRQAVEEQVRTVLEAMDGDPAGDARTARAFEAAFALARRRSEDGLATDENRAAILALAVVLGSERFAPFAGPVASEEQLARAARLRSRATLRGRADWTRHFVLSSALTVVSNVAPSNAAGLLKEELDAASRSGFSFGDLLADRAGTTFGAQALAGEARAAALQERVAAGFAVGDFFPPATGLPEGIPDSELLRRYGGVGGPLYLQTMEEIERRIAACPGYAPPAP